MTRTKIAFLFAASIAFALSVQEANSASFGPTGAVKESAANTNPVQEVHISRCVTHCHWGWYRAGNGKIYTGCHRNDWSCAWASPCNPKACRWWHWWH